MITNIPISVIVLVTTLASTSLRTISTVEIHNPLKSLASIRTTRYPEETVNVININALTEVPDTTVILATILVV